MEQKLLNELETQLKNFLDDYEDTLKSSTEKTKEDLDLMIEELRRIQNTLLVRIAGLENKSRKLSLLIEV